MEDAIRYTELVNTFVVELLGAGAGNVEVKKGRKFDRVFTTNGNAQFFIDKINWNIYGAKSNVQFNQRRWYGTLETVDQFSWTGDSPSPKIGSVVEVHFNDRERSFTSKYKRRGRPRKVAPVDVP